MRPTGARSSWFAIALGGLAPIAVAIVLVPLRDEIDNANLALILVFVVVIAAILGGRRAGAVAAVTSTLAFDFFLTRPFLSARVESADDIETLLILLAVGLLVGELASRRTTRRGATRRKRPTRCNECTASPTRSRRANRSRRCSRRSSRS